MQWLVQDGSKMYFVKISCLLTFRRQGCYVMQIFLCQKMFSHNVIQSKLQYPSVVFLSIDKASLIQLILGFLVVPPVCILFGCDGFFSSCQNQEMPITAVVTVSKIYSALSG